MSSMSLPRSRFERNIDIPDIGGTPTTRFARLNKDLDRVDLEIKAGATVTAKVDEKRILVELKPNGLSGKFPSLEIGLRTFGEVLDGSPMEIIEGEAPGIDVLDKELLAGYELTVDIIGKRIRATWSKKLPPRDVEISGGKHQLYQTSIRSLVSEISGKLLETARSALAVKERIEKGSVLNPQSM